MDHGIEQIHSSYVIKTVKISTSIRNAKKIRNSLIHDRHKEHIAYLFTKLSDLDSEKVRMKSNVDSFVKILEKQLKIIKREINKIKELK